MLTGFTNLLELPQQEAKRFLQTKRLKTMKSVTVIFNDESLNYVTSVGAKVSFQEAVDYFVGKWFNLGKSEADNMQQCVAIIFE